MLYATHKETVKTNCNMASIYINLLQAISYITVLNELMVDESCTA
jgi:hypothetical protein